MSINLSALATWSYDTGTLTHIPTGNSVVIDISANPALHLILSAAHWKNLGSKEVYSSNPADWVERRIKWNRTSEDPPVLQIEKTIGAADFKDYAVYLLEDSPEYSAIFESLASIHNSIRTSGSTPAHERAYMKKVLLLFQKAGLIGEVK